MLILIIILISVGAVLGLSYTIYKFYNDPRRKGYSEPTNDQYVSFV
jgi:hypothetical protein